MDRIHSSQRIPELDGVRGIAVSLVLVWHYFNCQGAAQLDGVASALAMATRLTWSGVDLFFVLSGFLIGGILLDNIRSASFFKVFYIRRCARILPVYIFLLVLYFLCRLNLEVERFSWLFSDSIPELSYLFFVQNVFMGWHETFGGQFLGVTWSLAVEEQFYLFTPLLFYLLKERTAVIFVITFACLAPCLRLLCDGFPSIVNMFFRMDSLLSGVILAVGVRSSVFCTFVSRRIFQLWVGFLVLSACMGVLTYYDLGRNSLEPTLIALFYSCCILLILHYRDSALTRFLRSKALAQIGLYSYGIYMYHQMIAGLVHGYFFSAAPSLQSVEQVLATVLCLCITILFSALSFHSFELFFLRQGRALRYEGSLAR